MKHINHMSSIDTNGLILMYFHNTSKESKIILGIIEKLEVTTTISTYIIPSTVLNTYNIREYPTVIVAYNGEEYKRIAGVRSYSIYAGVIIDALIELC
jgi:hypothetical protein